MFIRRKRNASGSISIQIIQKIAGKNKVLRTIGSSNDLIEIEFLIQKGRKELNELQKSSELPFSAKEEMEFVNSFVDFIDSVKLVGPELLLGKLFDEIGFNQIDDELFRHLVITRLVYPVSKLKTTDYLYKYKGIKISVYSIYRYLDKLHKKQLDKVREISLNHTLNLFGGKIAVVFYDVTTLYFEAKQEDEFRKTGFSKDGKHQNPQIVLGLLVSENGYPLDYDVFEGNKYEGDTLIPIIEHFQTKHQPEQLIVVADAGLLSKKNIDLLVDKKYQYILEARIKNENEMLKRQITQTKLADNQSVVFDREDGSRLILSYKKARALKDQDNRKRGLERLEKKIKNGKLTKENINNKGYNKYLKIEGEATISIDYEKDKQDAIWDGLKGYKTNTKLTKEQVIEQYHQLWAIEKTFRISKSDLEIRPIYHQLKRRIETHIGISFCACKIYKELERQLKEKQSNLSPEKVIDILKTIYQVSFETPFSNKVYTKLLLKNQEQKDIINLFNLEH
ncbi:transposase [Flavobacterium covae]|uniref:IS1634 family transposase n=1 Tax=Flavobacterium covae TaxID=2906076 RepID=UPI0007C1D87D|nr:IS1634 family transposase [Flavobacterium covae]AND65373.1 transposase [Flavobacterium covae]